MTTRSQIKGGPSHIYRRMLAGHVSCDRYVAVMKRAVDLRLARDGRPPVTSYFAYAVCGTTWSLAGEVVSAPCPDCEMETLRRPRRPLGQPLLYVPESRLLAVVRFSDHADPMVCVCGHTWAEHPSLGPQPDSGEGRRDGCPAWRYDFANPANKYRRCNPS